MVFQAEVASAIPITINKMPRLSEPGPLGMRAEHWYDYSKHTGDINLLAKALAQLAVGNVPDNVPQYFKSGQVSPLPKPTGGHRPLLLSSFMRRVAHKALL